MAETQSAGAAGGASVSGPRREILIVLPGLLLVFARRLTDAMGAVRPGVHLKASAGNFNPVTVNRLPAPIRHDVFYAIAHAIQGVFFWAAPSGILLFVLAWLIKEVPLRGSAPAAEAPASEPEFAT